MRMMYQTLLTYYNVNLFKNLNENQKTFPFTATENSRAMRASSIFETEKLREYYHEIEFKLKYVKFGENLNYLSIKM
jgi:hypothetical protein